MWLEENLDGQAERSYFPNSDGTFSALPAYGVFTVQGPPILAVTPRSQSRSLTLSSTPSNSSNSFPPNFRSVISAKKSQASFSLKIIRAVIHYRAHGKPDFIPMGQTYIELMENTATLDHILRCIREKWGDDYYIVTADGLALEESAATHGSLKKLLTLDNII